MFKQCSVQLFNPKGLFKFSQKMRNPGMHMMLMPKSIHPGHAHPKANMPYDENQVVAPELVGSHNLRIPEIMRGIYGRRGKVRGTMEVRQFAILAKLSAYRWLKREEHKLRDKNNISAALEEHGLSYEEFANKRYMQKLPLANGVLNNLAKREPLAFRCYAEVIRSDNLLAYDHHPEILEERTKAARRAKRYYNHWAMRKPLPTRVKLADPTWRDIPYMEGRQYDTNFHPQHPIFTVDWKI